MPLVHSHTKIYILKKIIYIFLKMQTLHSIFKATLYANYNKINISIHVTVAKSKFNQNNLS